jgi:nicotinate-nucleotide adenylyltransferase
LKLALLGGSFNPIHIGHLYLADAVLSALDYDRIVLIPACVSPFKQDADTASAADRQDMILASIPADSRLSIDDTELRRGGVSFTIDTVHEIIERYRPEGKPGLVLGDDLVSDFHQWKSAAVLAEKTGIVIARRLPAAAGNANFPFAHTSLQNGVLPVSSAEVRRLIASDGPWRNLVPQGARFLIEERGLYGCAGRTVKNSACGACGPLCLAAAVETAARTALSPSRFLHSRNTALMAVDLARRFGLDPDTAYLAGIGHDLGKNLNAAEMIALAERYGQLAGTEHSNPALLHGRAAAVLLRERFGVHNKDVLEAVAFHTTGASPAGNTSPLVMALFIADKLEYSRQGVDPALRELALNGQGEDPAGLEAVFYAVVEDNIRYLRGKGLNIAQETLDVRALLQRKQP